jgi:hypothetical protein
LVQVTNDQFEVEYLLGDNTKKKRFFCYIDENVLLQVEEEVKKMLRLKFDEYRSECVQVLGENIATFTSEIKTSKTLHNRTKR